MCGIYGFDVSRINNLQLEKKAMLAAILAVGNDSRGGDSWGYYTPKSIQRGLGDIAKVAQKTVREPLLMAHTRKATTGTITVQNAHPFEIGEIIGAHNGIITNHFELNKKYNRDYSVDSMHLFGHLNEGKEFSDITGYGAIQFVRKETPNRIYLCKLSAGDLNVYGIGKGVNQCVGVVWSSDEDHVTAALTAANLKSFAFNINQGQVYYVENGMLYYDGKTTLELAKFTSNSYVPDWRLGMHNSSYLNNTTKDQSADDMYEEYMRSMAKDEKELEETPHLQMWEREERLRLESLKERTELEHTHVLNSDEDIEEEWMPNEGSNGKWVMVRPDGTVVEGVGDRLRLKP